MSGRTYLSIYICRDEIKIVSWSNNWFSPRKTIRQMFTLPANRVARGEDLKQLLRDKGVGGRSTYLCLAVPELITRIVKVPIMEEKDLAGYLDLEVEDLLLIDKHHYLYDYRVLRELVEEEKPYFQLLLTGIPRAEVEHWVGLVEKAGLKPLVVDVYPNALSRLFASLTDRDVAVLDITSSMTHLTIFERGCLYLYAGILQGHDGIAATDPQAIAGTIDALLNDLRAYLNFFAARHFGKEVDEIYLINDLCRWPGAPAYMTEVLGIKAISDIPPGGYLLLTPGRALEEIRFYAINLGLLLRKL